MDFRGLTTLVVALLLCGLAVARPAPTSGVPSKARTPEALIPLTLHSVQSAPASSTKPAAAAAAAATATALTGQPIKESAAAASSAQQDELDRVSWSNTPNNRNGGGYGAEGRYDVDLATPPNTVPTD
jgi:hypothetical protein